MLQDEIKDWTFEAYLLTEETSLWFLLIEQLKVTCARSSAVFEFFGLSFAACLTQTQ